VTIEDSDSMCSVTDVEPFYIAAGSTDCQIELPVRRPAIGGALYKSAFLLRDEGVRTVIFNKYGALNDWVSVNSQPVGGFPDIGAQTSENVIVTSATGIKGFPVARPGTTRKIRFQAATVTLNHNHSDALNPANGALPLKLPADANILARVDDVIEFVAEPTCWRLVSMIRWNVPLGDPVESDPVVGVVAMPPPEPTRPWLPWHHDPNDLEWPSWRELPG